MAKDDVCDSSEIGADGTDEIDRFILAPKGKDAGFTKSGISSGSSCGRGGRVGDVGGGEVVPDKESASFRKDDGPVVEPAPKLLRLPRLSGAPRPCISNKAGGGGLGRLPVVP